MPAVFGLPSAAGPCGARPLSATSEGGDAADGLAVSGAMPVLLGAGLLLPPRVMVGSGAAFGAPAAPGVAAATAAVSPGSACAIASVFATGRFTGATKGSL